MEWEEVNLSSSDTLFEIDGGPDLGKLRSYKRNKLSLADRLRVIRESLKTLGLNDAEQHIRELTVKLAEDQFTLAVLGQYKRGKSSLMNAIIGRDLLPTGMLPLTSAITSLRYGPEERLVVTRENSRFTEELPITLLPDFVTENGNPSNEKKVKKVVVELPVRFLRQGLEFVDTPGVGSAITANTVVTYEFLPDCDAVILVTSVDSPLSDLEIEFLKEIRQSVDRVFVVLNKTDLVSARELTEVLEFVRRMMMTHLKCESLRIYPVSARSALRARMIGDAKRYEESGLRQFEGALAGFLSREKSTAFLGSVIQKALRILTDKASQSIVEEAALLQKSLNEDRERSVSVVRDPDEAIRSLNSARNELATLHEGISKGERREEIEQQVHLGSRDKPEPIQKDTLSPAGFKLSDLEVRGCAACQHISNHLFHFFAQWQYAISSDEISRMEFAVELGFCPLHTWQLLSISSPRGASLGLSRLSEEIAGRLRSLAAQAGDGDSIRPLVHNTRSCRVCRMIGIWETEYVGTMTTLLETADFCNRYRRSQGLCVRHLGLLLDVTPSKDTRKFLLSHAAQAFEDDAEDMRTFALKREALRRSLENKNEEDAYRRAGIRLAGNRNVCVPWIQDGEI